MFEKQFLSYNQTNNFKCWTVQNQTILDNIYKHHIILKFTMFNEIVCCYKMFHTILTTRLKTLSQDAMP